MTAKNPLVVVRRELLDGKPVCRGLWIWCPGCKKAHRPRVALEDGTHGEGPIWTWNGATDKTFTIEPSLLCTWTYKDPDGEGEKPIDARCHSFIRNGVWDFLADSTHALAGKQVPMVPVPGWLARRDN